MVSTGLSADSGSCGMKAIARPSSARRRARRHVHQILAVEQPASRGDRKARRQKLGDGAADHRFSRAGFADQAEDFSGLQG